MHGQVFTVFLGFLKEKNYGHPKSRCLLRRKKDSTRHPQKARASVDEGEAVHTEPDIPAWKLILLTALHPGLFVSRLLSVHYNPHTQEEGNWPHQWYQCVVGLALPLHD